MLHRRGSILRGGLLLAALCALFFAGCGTDDQNNGANGLPDPTQSTGPVVIPTFVESSGSSPVASSPPPIEFVFSPPPPATNQVSAHVKCVDVFKVGQNIDPAKAAAGCADSNGAMHTIGSFHCADGRRLWQVNPSTGAPDGWGFDGDPFRSGHAETDIAYAAAYAACVATAPPAPVG